MTEEIEDLYALADECREWARGYKDVDVETPLSREFKRLADKLDEIAKVVEAALRCAEAKLVMARMETDRLRNPHGTAIGQGRADRGAARGAPRDQGDAAPIERAAPAGDAGGLPVAAVRGDAGSPGEGATG